jgi:hypothetical protein
VRRRHVQIQLGFLTAAASHGRMTAVTDLELNVQAVLDSRFTISDAVEAQAARVLQQRDKAQGMLRAVVESGAGSEDPLRRYWQGRVDANLDFNKAMHHEACADLLRSLAARVGPVARVADLAQLREFARSPLEQRAVQSLMVELAGPLAMRIVHTANGISEMLEASCEDSQTVNVWDGVELQQERLFADVEAIMARVGGTLGLTQR